MDSAERLRRSLFSMQEKKRKGVASKPDVLMLISWPDFSTQPSGQVQTVPLVIISLWCSVWSCWRPQHGQAPPSNAAKIPPAGLRVGLEWAMPHSVSFQTLRAFWGFSGTELQVATTETHSPLPLLTTLPPSKACISMLMLFSCGAFQFSSVTQSCPTLCDPMDCSTPGFRVHHHHLELQTHVHCVSDAIQPSHPLSSPSPPALNISQHRGLFQWVCSSHQVAKALEFQPQHQSFQWIVRTDFL